MNFAKYSSSTARLKLVCNREFPNDWATKICGIF